ncbi:MAG: retropepsin-like domain-containing protein [Verrucomicrobiota bacterium]|nr:retropepsin-like domain-containing protein [Verrucomicrobiota bacterium]
MSSRLLRSFAAALVLASAISNAAGATSTRSRHAQTAARASKLAPQFEALPLTRSSQNHLLVRAYINGKPALLGVDTGAPVSAIASDRRAYFGLKPIPGTSKLPPRLMINGAFSSVGIVKTLRLGALNLVDEPMVALDLNSGSGPRLDGILGADVLFPTRAIIDCRRQLLILNLEPNGRGTAPGVDYTGFQSVPIHVSDGYNLYVDGVINGTPAQLMIDTGAFTTLLHRSFVRRMKIPMRDTQYSSAAVNMRQRGVKVARIQKLSVGAVFITGHNVGVIDLNGLIHGELLGGSRPVAGLLGSEFFQRQHCIIDFGARRLYLKG